MRAFAQIFVVAITCLIVGVSSVWAQDVQEPDYGAWRHVVDRATEAIDNDRASEAAMDSLRGQLSGWRATFSDESSRSRISVTTLEAQLNRLGSVPEGGEAEDVAEERRQLQLQLSEAQAPVRRAELAQTEADELIRSIDILLRNRQAQLLLEPGPFPLTPGLWWPALKQINETFRLVALEFQTGWIHEKQRNELRKSLPTMLFYLVISVALLTQGMRWTDRVLNHMTRRDAELSAIRWVMVFVLSYGQVILPMLGVFAFSKAVYATDLPGLRGDVMLSVLPLMTFELLTARWLGERIFSRHPRPLLTINLTSVEKRQGRHASTILGAILAFSSLFVELARYENWDVGTEAVVFFVLSVVAALFLARLGHLITRHARTMRIDDEAPRTAVGQLIFLMGRYMMFVSLIAVVLSFAGLTRGASYLVFSSTRSMFLVAFLLVMQRLIQKIFAALAGKNEEDDSSLASVVVGIALIVLALPVFALCWGAQITHLHQAWQGISKGLTFGDLVLSPETVFLLIVVYAFGHAITRLVQAFLRDNILPKTSLDVGGQNAMVSGAGYVGIFLAALVALTVAGINLSNIALFAGALSVGIGFGLQNIVSNFVSGIILLVERPVSEGDWIEVGGQMGYVRDISVRSTRIETFDRTDVVVPNSDLVSGTVTNYTRGNTVGRVIVPVGVAYGTDTRWVEGILMDIAQSHPMVLANPGPSVVFQGFGADSLDFEIRAILRDVNWMLTVKSDLNHEIARRFVEEGIEIPFAQRDVWLRNPETLRGEEAKNAMPVPPVMSATSVVSAAPTPPDLDDMDGEADGDGR
ncbi:mechanosensitive ion channel family protein [Shimia sp.]|uniref:mechanosensitive ion channel family protein n=1 Tax=Shimia sp. TaxID=1954381 RepID=UPI003B8AED1B